MKTREEIITSMCYTWRHDYGLNKIDHDEAGGFITAGLTDKERDFLWNQMAQIYDNDIAPHIKELSRELLGVITDVEEGDGFDSVCLNTIKRVHNILAGANQMSDKGYSIGSFDNPKFKETRAKYSDIISDGGMDPRK